MLDLPGFLCYSKVPHKFLGTAAALRQLSGQQKAPPKRGLDQHFLHAFSRNSSSEIIRPVRRDSSAASAIR